MTRIGEAQGLTNAELKAAADYHQRMGDAYQSGGAKKSVSEVRAAMFKLAAHHQAQADLCRKEIKRRKRAGAA